jgi:hypothetical protein
MTLERQGYKVLEAVNGVEALKVWREHREAVALLLTDLVMRPARAANNWRGRFMRKSRISRSFSSAAIVLRLQDGNCSCVAARIFSKNHSRLINFWELSAEAWMNENWTSGKKTEDGNRQ